MKLLQFTSDNCAPCHDMRKAKTVEKLADKHGLNVVLHDTDTKGGDKIADKYDVECVPTIILVSPHGTELARVEGGASLAMLEKAFKKHLA